MIISRTPFRISFFGGGTDYPAWYRNHGGSVLVSTIDKYCYLACRYYPPFFDHRFRIAYIKSENCRTIDEISHPAVRGVLRYLNWDRGLEIHHVGDLPARGGMGSSSSFTVGLLHALYGLRGKMLSKQQLTLESVYIEQEVLQETVGSQDQTAAAHGGLNHVIFSPNGEITVRPLTLSVDRLRQLEAHLMLFYTGIKRTASDVAQSYVQNIDEKKQHLAALTEMVSEGMAILYGDQDITQFGQLLDRAWQVKRAFSAKISNSQVDEMYKQAIAAGALGGKILGAGGGGFMVLFVPPSLQNQVRERLSQFIHVPFKFEFSGSQIVFYDPEQDFSVLDREHGAQPMREFQELESIRP
ncbi:MAG: kinase [Candidatus Competibacteraceae bacterium]|nr:kinase [Candidatus Competibacteraceae bacterium]